MASRKLKDLHPNAQNNAHQVQSMCQDIGIDLLIYCTMRSLEEQARLYRQSRAWAQINHKLNSYRENGLDFLAEIVIAVGPCHGRHVTNAAPGESWHNYGEAWDAVPMVGGKPAWNYLSARGNWDAYGDFVRQVDMDWAGDWTHFREYPHAQLRPGGNPLKTYSADEIHALLEKRGLL